MSRLPVAGILLVLLSSLLLACDESDKPLSAEDGRSLAQDALLQLGDFPSGWESRPYDPDSTPGFFDSLSQSRVCAEAATPEVTALGTADSDAFDKLSAEYVTSRVLVFTSQDDAETVFESYRSVLRDCSGALVEGWEASWKAFVEGDDLDPDDYTWESDAREVDAQDLVPSAWALHVETRFDERIGGSKAGWALLVVRRGNMVGLLDYAMVPEDGGVYGLQELAMLFSSKLDGASVSN